MKVTTKGQVTIPLHIRERFGILPNTEVEFKVENQNLVPGLALLRFAE